MEPRRTSRGRWSVDGVPLVWPATALHRARRIRRLLERGFSRTHVRLLLIMWDEIPAEHVRVQELVVIARLTQG